MTKYYLLIILLIFGGCQDSFFEEPDPSDVKNNFKVFWSELDRNYAYFDFKNIDWDSVYTTNINKIASEQDLKDVLYEVVQFLRDGHVNIFLPGETFSYSGWKDDNTLNLSSYYQNYVYKLKSNGNIYYDFIKNENIGYINIPTFSDLINSYEGIDDILYIFKNTKGIIIDIRSNGGGSDLNALRIATRFADEKRLYRKVRYRNGPEHNDFTNWIDAFIFPEGDYQYLNKVVVLTNKACFSSTEGFVLKMKALPHVTIIGNKTGGGNGNPVFRDLPNGWSFRFSNWQVATPDEQLFEGIGITPDIAVEFTKEDSIRGIDVMIEEAIHFLKN